VRRKTKFQMMADGVIGDWQNQILKARSLKVVAYP
jgi:hypothetical protein